MVIASWVPSAHRQEIVCPISAHYRLGVWLGVVVCLPGRYQRGLTSACLLTLPHLPVRGSDAQLSLPTGSWRRWALGESDGHGLADGEREGVPDVYLQGPEGIGGQRSDVHESVLLWVKVISLKFSEISICS